MQHDTRYLFLSMTISGVACFLFFRFAYTVDQFIDYFNHPAPLSCLGGDFLTQFFHNINMGAAVVALTMAALGTLTYFTCRKWTNRWIAIGISIVVFIWESLRFCQIQYPFSATLSLIGALSLFLLTDKLKGKWDFFIGSICGTMLCYSLFGYGMFAFTLFTILSALKRKQNYVVIYGMIPVALALPPLAARKYLVIPSQAYSFPATLWYGTPDFENERILGLNTELPEKLMDYYQPAGLGLFMPVNEKSTYLSTQLSGEVWFRLGDMTMAEHASLLSMIFSPQNKSVRMVQRLAEINLINGDNEAARKYLRILSNTLFYKEWAKKRTPGKESPEVKEWLKYKRSYLPQKDTLRLSSTDVVKSLHLLMEANPANQMARDYLLCFDLLMKDLSAFLKDYKRYHTGAPNRLYAEALLIHLYQKRATGSEIKSTGITPVIVQDFNEYNRLHTQGNSSALESRFGRTYWYYYQFAQFQ